MKAKFILIALVVAGLFFYINNFFINDRFEVNNKFIKNKEINRSSVPSFKSAAEIHRINVKPASYTSMSLSSFAEVHAAIKTSLPAEEELSRQYFIWGIEYSNQLPSLINAEMAGNFMDGRVLHDLKTRAEKGDLNAQKEYASQLNNLKNHADAGDVKAQMDYADNIRGIKGSSAERLLNIEKAKEYYIKAAVAGQAQAAGEIAGDYVFYDPIEALAWGFIANKLGTSSYSLYVCTKASVSCSEDGFIKAYERAKFYIDFYEFKVKNYL